MNDTILLDIDPRGVARLTLNRPERHNAFDDALIAGLSAALEELGEDPRVRAVVLTGAGRSFSAGADLDWMRRMAEHSQEDNLADAAKLARLMHLLARLPKPTLALVQGAAYGGGVGLACCCDVVLAADTARFCLSEVRLGLTPATISPYVVAAIGARQARRYFTTAEVIPPHRALEIGLVHEVVPAERLEEEAEKVLEALLQGAPGAQAAAKDLVFLCEGRVVDEALSAETGRRIAERRASEEGREGLGAFLDKRPPAWRILHRTPPGRMN
jgi:methylglutaconyl-CoA hydratase